MITLSKIGNAFNRSLLELMGLSTASKPVNEMVETDDSGNVIAKFYIANGSLFTELDTGKKYLYDEENQLWYEFSSNASVDTSAYGTSLELTINSSTYVMTATLKNENGDTLGTPQTIDLPLETMVVGGTYDDNTKKIVLTLNSGQTIEFSVADLVSGLQSEITSQSKLASDLVDDTNQTNKFVTAAEKAKLSDIDSKVDTAGTGLSKSDTTINHTNSVTAKTTQGFAQIAYDTEGHITGSTAVTTAQENAINSGVTAGTVAQVATNTTDIETLWGLLDIKVYGYKINKSDSNPNTRVEYLYDAVGMTPAHMNFTTGEFDYGSWENVWFVKNNRPVALKFDGTVDYELDHDDYSKKIDGVTASDITDSSYAGNFMSEIPLVWVKRWEDNDYNYVAFCSQRLDNDYHAYAHTNANGEVNSVCYMPIFKGSIIDDKMRSIAGQTPTGDTTGSTEKTAAEACGSGWQLWDWSKHELIADLLTLISKSTDSQGKFGQGGTNCYISSASDYGKLPTGGYNSTIGDISTYSFAPTGQFWGSSATNKHVKIFHIEDFWGNRFDRCLGVNLVDGVYKVKMRLPYALDSDSTYDVISDVTSPNSDHILNVSTGNYGSLPTQIGASQSTGFCDYFWKNSGNRLLLFGGSCGNNARCGSRCLYFYDDSGARYWSSGGSPCFNTP